MELTLLGTAAAEGWPAAFCRCAACDDARRLGGRDIRSRSGALWGDDFKIDFGPDTLSQMQRRGRDLSRLTTLAFTHAHDDHFTPAEPQYRGAGFVKQTELPLLHVYGPAAVMDTLHARYPDPGEQFMELHPSLEPLRPVVTPEGDEILPLPAAHAPGSLLLRFTRQGKSVLYGHDSGPFPEDTVRALAGVPLSVALLDCTYGPNSPTSDGHMGIARVLETIARLRAVGAVTDGTQLIATHFSHNGGLLHAELTEQLAPHGVTVAHDGLTLMP